MLLLIAQFIYNSIKSNIMGIIFFTALYNYKLELIREAKNIKIIIKKIKILII